MSQLQTPSCGRCAYSTIGLRTMICPECGGDLRQVGITGPRSNRPLLGSLATIAKFTIAMLLFGILLTAVVTHLWPTCTSMRSAQLTAPASAAYLAVSVNATAHGWSDQVLHPAISIELSPRPGQVIPRPLTFDPARSNVDAIRRWLTAGGIDPAVSDVEREVTAIESTARRLSRPISGPDVPSSSSSGRMEPGLPFSTTSEIESNSTQFPGGVALALWITWCLVWIAGVCYLWRLRDR